ncbi:PBSX family phage terminase large subunit [Fructobacillus fructosus]|uniref:PBSX family phage terminase large subunit n=1 Tax=Fructobacillus fructosus TaxID=1631 RepID=UPI002D933FDC|nr:Phage terminase large subunit (XtmB) [Fructobacillus fructosus]CAK1236185.1 Phage terminase large subunit (XtmB) [Fructobacillus fructosus]CAK1237471.1 Phage terminase large subunit (XtmB) [Fructobacillus fructosus]
MTTININFHRSVDKSYYPLFASHNPFVAIKGARGSGKSWAQAYNVIYEMLRLPYVNWLVIRQYQNTNKESTYNTLKKVITQLGLYDLFKFTVSPLEITMKSTGQKIYFRGMDDPLKITSISAENGYLCRAWWEEAYELKSREDFQTVVESLRGQLPDGGYYQHVLTFNPWSERHWLKKEFFDEDTKRNGVLSFTTTYKNNSHLDQQFIDNMMELKERNPNRARVAVDGEWGIAEGLVFEGLFNLEDFDVSKIKGRQIMGLDFGFTHDPTAFVKAVVKDHDIYVYDGFYETGMLSAPMARKLARSGALRGKVYADSAEPRTIAELQAQGLKTIVPVGKGKDSNVQRMEFMKNFKYHIHPSASYLVDEMSTFAYQKDRFGKFLNKPEDGDDHAIQALGYALEPIIFTNSQGKYMNYRERVKAVNDLGLR